jgi:CRP/FNR family transcriptional regulator, cyclic AMP receptor protein
MRGRRRTSLAFLNRSGPSCRIPFGVLTSSGWHHILSPLEGPLLQDERIVALRRFAVLKALSDAALHEVERKCRWRNYGAGEHILDRQDTSTDVFFLLSGKARAISYSRQGKPVTFVELAPGEMFGEIAAIDRNPRSASIEALEACRVVALSAEHFEQLMLREPSVAVAVLRYVVAAVRRLSERVFEFSALAVQNRIHAELLRMAGEVEQRQSSVTLSPAPSLADIASRISTHREAVSRELSRLTSKGLLRRERGDLIITNLDKLREIVNEAKDEF